MTNPAKISDNAVGGRQRSVTTLNITYLIQSHEKLMDFYHMKGMIAKTKAEQFRLFSIRDKHFKFSQQLVRDYPDERN